MKSAAHGEPLRFVDPDEFKVLRQDAALTHQ